MSNCRVCSRAIACDWEEPPENCLDFIQSILPPIDKRIDLYIDKYCEIIMRGGSRFFGWVRGMDAGMLVFECEDHCLLSVDLDAGAEIVSREEFVDED